MREQSESQVEEEEDSLRRTVRRSLRSLRLPALNALLRVIRYAEEGKTPMAVAAEDMIVSYKLEAIFREAEQLRRNHGARLVYEEDKRDESQSRRNSDKGRQTAAGQT